jgi:hypothetical protein
MVGTGFEIAFGIFLFILALAVLVYGLSALLSLIILSWDWTSKKGWWAKMIIVLVILQILGWILGISGVGR